MSLSTDDPQLQRVPKVDSGQKNTVLGRYLQCHDPAGSIVSPVCHLCKTNS